MDWVELTGSCTHMTSRRVVRGGVCSGVSAGHAVCTSKRVCCKLQQHRQAAVPTTNEKKPAKSMAAAAATASC